MKPAVQLQGVTHVYVSKKKAMLAVENIDLDLYPGEFVSLVGPSGCGKTTILSIIAGLLDPTIGRAEIAGRKVTGPSSRVGYMLQQDYLFPWRTIWQNALIGIELSGSLTKEKRDYTLHLLEEMGLLDAVDQYPSQLSGGMRQRAALVRTLAVEPEILLLDEPFSALDYQTKLQLEELVSQTLRSRSKTALLVTHDLSEAIAMSDRVIVLDRNPGRVRKVMEVPAEIRKASPMRARELPGFHELFRELWQELEQADEKGEDAT
ncbi:ABC transporter ATP-binding protein [Paenibacillus turpanensis]|uniref:ABC transporter ATP-binding protein n=1 Tax=Paenibacillus turpanensis TaxID=2689078 RepID=UPI00140A4E87|nr:ABC transporter ATP-binding protein [Paenibacillus turpanensis]